MSFRIGLTLLMSMSVMFAQKSHAGITLNNWQIDLAGVTGAKSGTVVGIDRILFTNTVNQTRITKGPGNLLPIAEPGDTGIINGALTASGLFDYDGFFTGTGGPIPNLDLNGTASTAQPWELTATFEANVVFIAGGPAGHVNFVHTGGANTFLKLFADEYTDATLASVKSSTLTGNGFADGDLIAAFYDRVTGGVNVFNPTFLDGSHKAEFIFDEAAAAGATRRILFDRFGNDLVANALVTPTALPSLHSLEFGSSFDAYLPTRIVSAWSAIDGQFGPANWATLFPTTTLPTAQGDKLNFFTLGDGISNTLSVVPEPASLLAFTAISLIGLGTRRRHQ